MTEESYSQYRGRISKSKKPVKTFVVQVAEKVSRDYEVIGASSMAEAVRLVKENGGHFYHDDGQQANEIYDSWEFHHDFAPKAVETLTSSPCVMNGKWFEKQISNRFTNSYLCNSIVKGGMGQLCRKCQQKLADGYTMRQEDE
jgi:hypothetical protein